jgi:hypothetical protein
VQSRFHQGARRVLPMDFPPPLGGRGRPSLRRAAPLTKGRRNGTPAHSPPQRKTAALRATGLAPPLPASGPPHPPAGGEGTRKFGHGEGERPAAIQRPHGLPRRAARAMMSAMCHAHWFVHPFQHGTPQVNLL